MDSLLGTEAWYSRLCLLTWRLRATKRSRRLLFRLAVSAPPTGATEYGFVLTPSATSYKNAEPPEKMLARGKRRGYANGTKWNGLASQIRFGFVPTPRAHDGGKGVRTEEGYIKEKERWGRRNGEDLPTFIARGSGMTGLRLRASFVEWMMGYPENWTLIDASKPSATASSPKSRRR